MTSVNAATARLPGRPAPIAPVPLYWGLFVGGIACFLLGKVLGGAGPVGALIALGGAGTCGLSWLLARALFRPDAGQAVWPRVIVGALFATAILSQALYIAPLPEEAASLLRRVLQNIHTLIGSTMLLLGLVEAIDGYGAAPKPEKRFRAAFAAGYVSLVFVSVILLGQSGLGAAATDLVKSTCAILAVVGATWAVAYRMRRPLARAPSEARNRRAPSGADVALGEKIKRLIETEHVYARADIKVADLARLTGEPDYKVSQCITGALGFANFNRLINHHRIKRAMAELADPALRDIPILTIALDCGFASIGPFNRAFKDAVGTTPSRYREMSAQERASACLQLG